MTKYKSVIKLGERYRDERSGIEGHATAIVFHATGCHEVCIEYIPSDALSDKSPKEKYFSEARMVYAGEGSAPKEFTYKSDVKLDKQYESPKDGITGRVTFIEFHEHMAPRVAVQVTNRDTAGNPVPKTWMVDEYLLVAVETQKAVAKQPGAKGPATNEVMDRRVR